jgi:hypothetical protein
MFTTFTKKGIHILKKEYMYRKVKDKPNKFFPGYVKLAKLPALFYVSPMEKAKGLKNIRKNRLRICRNMGHFGEL